MINTPIEKTASFMRLRPEGRTEEVIRRLIECIDLGLLEEGEQLPAESELAMQFGVATVTLRDALAYLRELKIIDTKRGRNGGSFVCPPVELPVEHLHKRLLDMSTSEFRDLCDEHTAISGAAARLAAKRSSSDHNARLQHYIDTLDHATTRTERRRADARFHIEIAVAAQSVRLTHAEMSLQAEVGELIWIPEENDALLLQQIKSEHQAIADAIRDGESSLAGALTESHVTKGIKRLIELRLELLSA